MLAGSRWFEQIIGGSAQSEGLWARLEHIPFGYGHPYSSRQLAASKPHGFVPKRTYRTVFLPPL